MKNPFAPGGCVRRLPDIVLLGLVLSLVPVPYSHAAETVAPPALQFTSGLPGRQVRLAWNTSPGVRYVIEKSSTLASGGWTRVALIEATDANTVWVDPVATTTRAFYRITQPAVAVFSISPPLLSTSGGTLILHGQCIPAGSSLVLDIEGAPSLSVPLTDLGGGQWQALVGGALPGGAIISARIVDGSGTTLLTLDQPITVTDSGRASDVPPSLPPAAPISAGVTSVDVAIKVKGTGADKDRIAPGRDNDCDGFDAGLVVPYLSKKGYDYYQAQSGRAAGGYRVDIDEATLPAGFAANPSSLPGEVSLQSSVLSLPCPAGPALDWVCTYRSLVPTSSGHGPGWDFSYNISIEPVPSNAGSSAARLLLRDGAGHTDTLHRQADGTYRCDGMFRVGSFSGNTFTLTFADQGTWTFKPLGASTDSGKISAITDRNGVALACAYHPDGTLASVSDAFGRSLAVEWSGSRISAVSAGSGGAGGAVYLRTEFSYSGTDVSMESVSCPFVPGESPVCNPTVFIYDSSASDPRLTHNLLTITDGAGRTQQFGYSSSTAPTAIDYDVCTSSHTYGSAASPPHTSSFELLPNGNYLVTQCDEIGRVTESVCDPLHRVLSMRQYTGFSTPGVPVTSSSNRPTGKLRASDPDFFETTCVYNRHHLPTRITYPDGSQDRVTYDCDLDPACPPRQRANPRVITIATPAGETRTVACDYLPGFGNPECNSPGNPIGGLTIKGGKNPGGGMGAQNRPGNPIGGLNVKGGKNPGGDQSARKGWDGTVKGFAAEDALLKKEEGGRHTPFQNKYRPSFSASARGITLNTSHVEYATTPRKARPAVGQSILQGIVSKGRKDDDCDGLVDDGRDNDCDGIARISTNVTVPKQSQGATFGERVGPKQKAWLCSNFRTSLRSSLGQTTTWAYDGQGNCVSETSPVAGRGALYEYNARGQRTSATTLNGASSSFRDEYFHDAATGFLSSVVCDSPGLALTTSFLRDDLGRVTSVTDPRGFDTLYAYNPLHQCVQVSSPPVPNRIVTTLTIDAGGYPVRCDTERRAPDGSLDAANPAYSSYFFHDTTGQLTRVAHEDRPSSDFDVLSIGEFAVCDYTYDAAGQLIRVSTPAVCRDQPWDLACAFTYDERGLLHRVLEGDTGNPGATGIVTTECDYAPSGLLTRCATIVNGGTSPETLYAYDGFHRPVSVTDPMGNVATFVYENDGYVTCSVYGQLTDVPGSEGNTLMSRVRKRPDLLHSEWDSLVSGGHAVSKHAINTKGAGGNRSSSARLAIKTKGTGAHREQADPFFALDVEDHTVTVERFTPGSAGAPVLETTTIDRSPAGLVHNVSLNGDLQLACAYDSAGRLASCTDGACTTTVTRDANGNVLSSSRTDHTTVVGAPNKVFTTACLYDALNRCTQTTDGTGNLASVSYDSLGRPVTLTEPGGLVVTTEYDGATTTGEAFSSRTIVPDLTGDGVPDIVEYTLVRSGELVRTTDSYEHTTAFGRDSLGRVTQCYFPDGTSVSTSYDALGRVDSMIYQDGAIATRQYDHNNRCTVVSWISPPGGIPADLTSYSYDGLGRCVVAAQGSSTIACSYDSTGNPLTETQDGQTVTRTFTHRGRSKITYPDGRTFSETRDALGQLLTISALGAGGAPISPPVVSRQYAGHRVLRSTQANGVVTNNTYRGNGEAAIPGAPDSSFDACVRVTVSNAASTILTDVLHRRDPNQRATRCDTLFSSAATSAGRSKIFTRDILGRVTACLTERREVTGGPVVTESDVAYTLDLEGRRLSATGGNNPGVYLQESSLPPGDEQMGQYTFWPGGPLQWDDSGNIAVFSNGAAGQLGFVHDAQGRLLAVNDPNTGSAIVSYTYDALGRLLSRSTGGGGLPPATTRFLYDGSECIQELDDDGTGTLSAALTFVSSGGIKHCISTRNGTITYPHGVSARKYGDGKGSATYVGTCDAISLITSSTGAVVERLDCDDACKPIFLDATGLPTSDTSSTTGLRWLAPASSWEPEIGMFAGPGSIYSPDLGTGVSSAKGTDGKSKGNIPATWNVGEGKK